jgi:ATP-binding cassette subfamily B protein
MAAVTDADRLPGTRGRHRASVWRSLLSYVVPHRRMLAAGWLLGALAGLAALAQPMVAKLAVDSLGQQRSLVGPVALLTALAVGGALLSAASTYLLGRAAESVVLSARSGLVSRVLRLRVGALDHLKPGDLLSRVTSDTTLLRSVGSYGLVHSVNATFLLVGSVVLMGMLDAVLLGVTLAVLALNGLAVLLVVPRIR